jgi:hypothetical protein
MKRDATILRIAAVVLTIGAAIAWAIPTFTGTRLFPVVPRRVQLVLPPSHPTAQGPVPVIYKAAPHSLLVLVPEAVDPRMVYQPDASSFRTPVYQPPGHLEKR